MKTLHTFAFSISFFALLPLGNSHTQAELSAYLRSSGAKKNIVKPASGVLLHPYLVPAGPYFQLFDWDTYFMGVALSYDNVGDPVATSMEDFLEFVDTNANDSGYVARE